METVPSGGSSLSPSRLSLSGIPVGMPEPDDVPVGMSVGGVYVMEVGSAIMVVGSQSSVFVYVMVAFALVIGGWDTDDTEGSTVEGSAVVEGAGALVGSVSVMGSEVPFDVDSTGRVVGSGMVEFVTISVGSPVGRVVRLVGEPVGSVLVTLPGTSVGPGSSVDVGDTEPEVSVLPGGALVEVVPGVTPEVDVVIGPGVVVMETLPDGVVVGGSTAVVLVGISMTPELVVEVSVMGGSSVGRSRPLEVVVTAASDVFVVDELSPGRRLVMGSKRPPLVVVEDLSVLGSDVAAVVVTLSLEVVGSGKRSLMMELRKLPLDVVLLGSVVGSPDDSSVVFEVGSVVAVLVESSELSSVVEGVVSFFEVVGSAGGKRPVMISPKSGKPSSLEVGLGLVVSLGSSLVTMPVGPTVVGSSLILVLDLVGSGSSSSSFLELVGSGLVVSSGFAVVLSPPPSRLVRISPRDCLLVVEVMMTGGGTVVSEAGTDSGREIVVEVVLSN
jgi:hypothetical protein